MKDFWHRGGKLSEHSAAIIWQNCLMSGIDQRLVTAIHESGHGVAYWRYRLPFDRIVVYRHPAPSQSLGFLRSLTHGASALKQGIACLAGAAAESRFTGSPVMEVLDGTIDHRMGLQALDDQYPLDTALGAAQKLVEMQWSNITLLAEALVEREMMDYDAVLRLLLRRAADTQPLFYALERLGTGPAGGGISRSQWRDWVNCPS